DMQEIWVGDTDGLELVVSTGDTIEVAEGDKRVVKAFTLPYHWATNTDNDKFLYSAALNSKDELLIDIEFTDGTYAVVVANSGFVVNSTDDDIDNNLGDGKCECDGPLIEGKPKCTLRAAIMEANQTENKDKIRFDIPTDDPGYNFETGTYWIWPQGSSLDEITMPVIIDGTSQEGFDGSPIIVIDGTDLGINAAHGLSISGGNSEIHALVITNFIDDAHGIHIRIKGGNIIQGNYIGVDPTGSGRAGMGANGILIDDVPDNVIGGTTAAARNIVSDNDNNGGTRGCGILIKGSNARNNTVLGNYIGTDVTGTIDIGNPTGVCIENAPENTIGGDEENARNLISGNSFGITITGKTAAGNK
ncbi:MAG: CSLREA domain-containing protein, partial [Cyclobacteriaceae bacterium]|nr:CSLREA domain-containing protein [Cyclobacteriaceae bacterium]